MANMVQVTNMFNYDNEIGTSQKPPKLLSLADYRNWNDHFDKFLSFTDTTLWIPILEGYTHLTYSWMDSDNVPKPASALTTEEKLLFDREKTAMATLQKRCEGSLDVKNSRKELLKKHFLVFKHIQNENLDDLATRFYHLMGELASAKTMSLEDVLGKIQSHDLNLKKKETNMEHMQDPSMYFAKTDGKSGSGVALFSGDGPDNSNENSSGCSYQSGFSATRSNSPGSQPLNSHHVTQRVAEDYMAMFSSFILSYENFIGGKIRDPEAIEEDYHQIDPVDLEEMHIQWNMAMLMRQAKYFLMRTGRKYIRSNSRTRMEDLVGAVSQAFVAEIHTDTTSEDGSSSDSEGSGSEVESQNDESSENVITGEISEEIDYDSADEAHSKENVSTTSVSEDEILLTKRVPEMTEEIPTAKVFMADMSDPSKLKDVICNIYCSNCVLVKDKMMKVMDDNTNLICDKKSMHSVNQKLKDNDKLCIDRIESLKRDMNSLTLKSKEQVYRLDMAYAEIEKRNEIVAEKNKEISNKEAEVIRLHRKLECF
ncbi:hypothetical protein L1987_48498 [Smallanthus sonchifolius]|uniref:Uncharacterized protein n=1 Tax=Smallanthus sonchifolius TaxID=185202 RepID=A0ACB9FT37_9ASTR|nr:hypothetical protein L1987_48498 [Smallanthus sonchifolius]